MIAHVITISCAGPGAADFTDQLKAARIKFTTFERVPGRIYAAAGEILTIAGRAASYVALAAFLVGWAKARASRTITVVTKEHKLLHVKGYSVEEMETILRIVRRVEVIDPVKPDDA